MPLASPLREMPRRALALLAGAVCLAAGGAAQRREAFEEKLFVREAELVFELPNLPLLRLGAFGPEDLIVMEDGLARPVTKVGAIEEGTVRSDLRGEEAIDLPSWTSVVWVDRVLAEPETAFLAALTLAQQAATLAKLGTVEVVSADPEPQIETASTREPRRLEQALAGLAGQARVERDRAAARPRERSEASSRPDAETLRRQLDRLLVHLAGRREPGPRLLFLVADGFSVTPQEDKALETGSGEAGRRTAVIQEAARLLAAYGWVTVVLPLRKEALGKEGSSWRDIDRFRVNHSDWGDTNNSVPPVLPGRPVKDSKLKWEGFVDALLQPNLSPLRALIEPTAGALVAQSELLAPTLESLGGRWHLYYQTQMPIDGRIRPIEVRLATGTSVRARQWVRSSTPEGLTEARLRRLLAGQRLPETLPLKVERLRDSLRLTIAPFASPNPVIPGPVRISLAYPGPDGPEIRHQIAPGIEAAEKGWTYELPLPMGAAPSAVLVEDLARERRRAVSLEPVP